ncbi:LOB domain-containing protein 37-like [Euphorbia lathyris]|uniref:LOB domain-containing protein 37-like n=1 Tax=Euphorbia lathyris TaxID=212925 RepID=UPI003313C4DC
MSCNGCRILRKGCSDDCMLRQCLQWIDDPQAQANATLFVAKFFGRAGLISFLSDVPKHHRPSLFQSLLYEAVGRTVNPVSGAVGMLWTGNWQVCQTAVMTVFRGGAIHPLPEFEVKVLGPDFDKVPDCSRFRTVNNNVKTSLKRKRSDYDYDIQTKCGPTNLDLSLTYRTEEKRRPATPSEESETTTLGSFTGNNCSSSHGGGERKLLTLFL